MRFDYVCFLDTETTGLDARVHELLQVGVVLVPLGLLRDYREHRVIAEVERSVYVLPSHIETADPDALRVNGYDAEAHRARGAVALADALDILEPIFERSMIAGHNVAFDWGFIVAAFESQGRALPRVDYHRLDTASLAFPYVLSGEIQSLTIHDIATALGVPGRTSRYHDALEDARIALDITRRFVELHALTPPRLHAAR